MKNGDSKRILIVEDDAHIAEGLSLNLRLQGYEIKVVIDGHACLHCWKHWRADLIVLDIMLPGIDGFSVLENIRLENERIPILILSAKGATTDKVKGLSLGGDDYLVKPFDLAEFLLRIDRLLVRSALSEKSESWEYSGLRRYHFGNNCIDFVSGEATCKTGVIRLTEQELKLLKLFILHSGKPLSRNRILELCWGYSGEMATRTVDNFIVRFRKYFEDNPRNPRHFKSLRSVGYRFDGDTTPPT